MKKSLHMLFAVMAIFVLVLAACAPAATPAPTQPPATEAPATEAPTAVPAPTDTAVPVPTDTAAPPSPTPPPPPDRKSTRLNSSHTVISYAVFCLKKKKKPQPIDQLGEGCTYTPLVNVSGSNGG